MTDKMAEHRLVMLGGSGVGKTALTIQLYRQYFVQDYDPTIEDFYRQQVVIDSQACMLKVLDTAGHELYADSQDQWIRDGEGFVVVYDVSSLASFLLAKKLIQRVKKSMSEVPIMLVGNKSDKEDYRKVSIQEGFCLARQLGCEFTEASAKECKNIGKAFHDIVRLLRRKQPIASISLEQSEYNTKKKETDLPQNYRRCWIEGSCCVVS